MVTKVTGDDMPFKKHALISVTDKSKLLPFAQSLTELGYSIISTGGTAKALQTGGVPVIEASEYTGSPEILNGRVKTLHPKIHGGLLFDRSNKAHLKEAQEHGITPIDLVVVNLYPFEEKAVAANLPLHEAIEYIDIGGPTMLRAAAKNLASVTAVIDPSDYDEVISALKNQENLLALRKRLAAKVFRELAAYNGAIASFLSNEANEQVCTPELPKWQASKELRYGENPHQKAVLLKDPMVQEGLPHAEILGGKELSYNNYLDLEAACALVKDLGDQKAVSIIKHTNPCGAAAAKDSQETLEAVYRRALASDPKSAFGGIVACNHLIEQSTARALSEHFLECVAAPGFSEEALEVLGNKKNLRLIARKDLAPTSRQKEQGWSIRSITGGALAQSVDDASQEPGTWKTPTQRQPTPEEAAELCFAMSVAKHTKSNAIVFTSERATLSIGAGQMSRIDAAEFAIGKAASIGRSLKGSVMASDAFFPFKDTVELAAKAGVSAIIQPGGSMRDQESIDACNENGIAMVFTGQRHFKH